MTPKKKATVEFTLAEARALIRAANGSLMFENALSAASTTAAQRALGHIVEAFGGHWSLRAGAVGSNLFEKAPK